MHNASLYCAVLVLLRSELPNFAFIIEKVENALRRQKEKQVIETRRRVRELDRLQCVFCGAQVDNNFRYVQVTPGEFLPENVVFSCAPCNTKIKHKVPEAASMTPKYGRFAEAGEGAVV